MLIATHCFFDNPHSYGRLLFTDFYEWLVFLCKISKETNYDWYIKPHPDYLPGTIEIINSIIEQKSDIKLINPKASFHDLKKEGLSWVITGFGSVGHELPLLDINVINCGPNPHVSYDFNWNPKTIEELKNILLNLKTLSKKIDKDAIYEFYYMYKFSDFLDNFIFNSYYKMLDEQGIGLTSKTYQYFLNEYNDDKHQKIIEQIQTFLKQKSNLSFISHDFIKNKINL